MINLTFNLRLHILWAITHIWFIVYLIADFNLLYLLLGYFWYVIIKGIGSEIGAHRYFSHNSFITTKLKENFLVWMQTLCGEGSILSFVGLHRMHHAYSDTEKDPHSPWHKSIWQVIFFTEPVEIKPVFVKGIHQIKQIRLQHKFYFYIHAVLIVMGFFISEFYAYFVALPIILSIYTNAAVNVLLHKYGQQSDNQKDQSRNNSLMNIFLYGAGYHSTHHQKPKLYRLDETWYKDILGYIIHLYFVKKPRMLLN